MRLESQMNPRKIGLILGLIALYFAVQSIIVEYLIENVLDPVANQSVIMVFDLFSVNAEETIPTWYAVLLLFMASVVLAFITAAKRANREPDVPYWIGLTLTFLYLSMDEGAVIHEIAAEWFDLNFDLTGFFTFGWQLVASPLVILFGLLYLRFLLRLPARTRNLFILAGVVYVGGAFFIEGISANQWDLGGGVSFEYLAIATVEEFCEMLGVVIFIYALLDYAVSQQYTYIFAAPPTTEGEAAPAAAHSGTTLNLRVPPALVSVLVLFFVGLNVLLVYWAFTQAPESTEDNTVAAAPTPTLMEQLVAEDIVVTRISGRFSLANPSALQVSAALRQLFDEIMVITLIPTDSSLILASDVLPFDRDSMAELLHTYGEVQFMIFDTNAVEALTAAVQPAP